MMSSKQAKDMVDEARDAANDDGSTDKAKGHTKEVIGSAKAKLGQLIGNEKLEAKGHTQNADGKKDRLKGEIKETIHDAKDKLKAGVAVVKDKIDEVRKR